MDFLTKFKNELDAKTEIRNQTLAEARRNASDAKERIEELKSAQARTFNADSPENFEMFQHLDFQCRVEEKKLSDAEAIIKETEKTPLYDLNDYASVVAEIDDHYLGVVAEEKAKIPAAVEALTAIRDAIKAAEAASDKCGRLLDAACRDAGHPVPRFVDLPEGGTKGVSHAAGIHTSIVSLLDKAIAELEEAMG